MAHTRSQDLEARFNTMQSGFLETQKEVKQLNSTYYCLHRFVHQCYHKYNHAVLNGGSQTRTDHPT
jgi:hypothetical protein